MSHRSYARLFVVLSLLLCGITAARGEQTSSEADSAYIEEHYTKYEYKIPMRDGVTLFTAVYVPKDAVADVSDPAAADALRTASLRQPAIIPSRRAGR